MYLENIEVPALSIGSVIVVSQIFWREGRSVGEYLMVSAQGVLNIIDFLSDSKMYELQKIQGPPVPDLLSNQHVLADLSLLQASSRDLSASSE